MPSSLPGASYAAESSSTGLLTFNAPTCCRSPRRTATTFHLVLALASTTVCDLPFVDYPAHPEAFLTVQREGLPLLEVFRAQEGGEVVMQRLEVAVRFAHTDVKGGGGVEALRPLYVEEPHDVVPLADDTGVPLDNILSMFASYGKDVDAFGTNNGRPHRRHLRTSTSPSSPSHLRIFNKPTISVASLCRP
ncbi:hypothetical protein K438DRAFT_1984228 [Mycena galopus ATCC 62051]|nr:hypothetical protein K438DRAFT_1984228 [Mycena galopus ATCC 62051]